MFSDSRASMPESGFRMEMSGQSIGALDAGCRTNQRAAHAAPNADMQPKTLAARQNIDSHSAADAPIRSRAIVHTAHIEEVCDFRTTPRLFKASRPAMHQN